MSYRERPTGVPGVVLWQDEAGAAQRRRILPDGCVDLVFDGTRLVVAGPDTTARHHLAPAGTAYTALRCAAGTGPALLGVSAAGLTDRAPDLAELWSAGPARRLAEQVAAGPDEALVRWARTRRAEVAPDPLGPRVLALAGAGLTVAEMSDRLGVGQRRLHRRCLDLVGYGPRRLGRVLRLGRALDLAEAGTGLAAAAAACGYVDQQHLAREARSLAGAPPTVLLRERSGR